jgi:hypothetical protein
MPIDRRKELTKYLSGGKLTARQTVLAKCYECTVYYADGKMDCKLRDCPGYPFFPYKEGRVQKSKGISEKQE